MGLKYDGIIIYVFTWPYFFVSMQFFKVLQLHIHICDDWAVSKIFRPSFTGNWKINGGFEDDFASSYASFYKITFVFIDKAPL